MVGAVLATGAAFRDGGGLRRAWDVSVTTDLPPGKLGGNETSAPAASSISGAAIPPVTTLRPSCFKNCLRVEPVSLSCFDTCLVIPNVLSTLPTLLRFSAWAFAPLGVSMSRRYFTLFFYKSQGCNKKTAKTVFLLKK